MKIKSMEPIICRTPAFAMGTKIDLVWEELKIKIKESSPNFYSLIEGMEANDPKLSMDEKMSFTIWKYFNRARFRATPFGTFAAFSTIDAIANNPTPIILNSQLIAHHFTDWREKDKQSAMAKLKPTTLLLANTTAYFCSNELRYIAHVDGTFQLSSVGLMPELRAMILYCSEKIALQTLGLKMRQQFQLSNRSFLSLLRQMINLQLLHTDNDANITGHDYFDRVGAPTTVHTNNYIIAERKQQAGSFDAKPLKSISAYLDFIRQHKNIQPNPDLSKFRKAFFKKFEHQAVSLAQAMDPELGIGYGNQAQLHDEEELVVAIKLDQQKNADANRVAITPLHQFLLNKMLAKEVIRLEEFQWQADPPKQQLPNTFSLMLQLYQNHPVISYAGGCTANALLGRFSMASKTIENYGKHLAALEAKANPDVLFFDIAYQVEQHIDNVNRRKRLYPLEFPILTWSETKAPLHSSEIWVAIQNNEVVLFHKQLGKRLVPRIPSAYNYTRSDLSVYRFLCDIQHQGMLSNLTLDLKHYFANLTHYPRVYYKEIIVSAAMWLLPTKFTDQKLNRQAKLTALSAWLQEQGINFMFKAGSADHTLCFDPNQEADRIAFLNFCSQQRQEVYLTEALINIQDGIKDENAANYAAEYIVNFSHQEQCYQPYQPSIVVSKAVMDQQVNLPGDDWLYFKIYAHPSRCNELLNGPILHFLNSAKRDLTKWFFIRYTDPDMHIRLRLQLKEPSNAFNLISQLKDLLKPAVLNGYIQDYKIETYYKETHRYGYKRMDRVEQFFFIDSQHVLYVTTKAESNIQRYACAISIIQQLCTLCFDDPLDRLPFIKRMAGSFAQEMQLMSPNFKRINASYADFDKKRQGLLIAVPKSIVHRQLKAFRKIMATCNTMHEKQQLLADLVHMHVNRLFISDQRIHETIIYHYLLRIYQAEQALLKVKQGFSDPF